MGARWRAVHGSGTNERTAMDHGARNLEVRGQPRGHFMDHGEEGGPTSHSVPTVRYILLAPSLSPGYEARVASGA